MPSFLVAQSANAAFTPTYVPVAVITGGTSGIGASIAKVLAQHLHGRIHIIIVGRNRIAADAIISSLPQSLSSDSTYEFVACDVTLMKNVHALAKDLSSRLPRINFLVHCAGVFGLRGREETEEGIDKKLASRYYARFALTYDLLPLLQKAADAGEAASVLLVLGAGQGASVDMGDLGLKKSYSGFKAMMQSICYNDLMVAGFAERHPQISFTHIYPGTVETGMLNFVNPIGRFIMFFLRPLIALTVTKSDVCAEYMTYALLDAEKGMNRRNSAGDDIAMKAFPSEAEDAVKVFWDHSVKETHVEL